MSDPCTNGSAEPSPRPRSSTRRLTSSGSTRISKIATATAIGTKPVRIVHSECVPGTIASFRSRHRRALGVYAHCDRFREHRMAKPHGIAATGQVVGGRLLSVPMGASAGPARKWRASRDDECVRLRQSRSIRISPARPRNRHGPLKGVFSGGRTPRVASCRRGGLRVIAPVRARRQAREAGEGKPDSVGTVLLPTTIRAVLPVLNKPLEFG